MCWSDKSQKHESRLKRGADLQASGEQSTR